MTVAEAVNEISDLVYRVSRECGRPMVLCREDREDLERILGQIGAPELSRFLPEPSCAFCGNKSKHHDVRSCRDRWMAEMRSLKSAGRA